MSVAWSRAASWCLGSWGGGNNVMSVAWSRAASCLWCFWSRVYVGPGGGIVTLYQWRGHVRLHVSGVYGHAYHVVSSCSMLYTYLGITL